MKKDVQTHDNESMLYTTWCYMVLFAAATGMLAASTNVLVVFFSYFSAASYGALLMIALDIAGHMQRGPNGQW